MNDLLAGDLGDYQTYIKPGGKFYDQDINVMADKIAKAKYDSDAYIKTLEMQKDEMREELLRSKEEYNKRAKLEELIDQLSNREKLERHNNPPVDEVKPNMDDSKIRELVTSEFKAMTKVQQEDANYSFVKDKLTERFGPNYQNVLKEKMAALELDADYVNSLARNKPKTLFKLLEVEDAAPRVDPFRAPPKSTQSSYHNPASKEKTWSHFQELKKSDPKAYFSKETQKLIHAEAIRQGESFFDMD